MAQNLGFARGGTSSWADDDDVDLQPLPAAPKIAHPRRGYQDDRRGGHQDDRRGGYDDRRGGYQDDRRGGYGDRRGGYDDRRGGYDDRRGGYEERRAPREERTKNPVPDVGPWKVRVGWLAGCCWSWVTDRRLESYDAPRERPRLTLMPRSTSTEKKESDAHKPSIFGDAKPRDENAYLERKKARDLERKAKAKEEKEAKAKAKLEKEAKAKADAEPAVLSRKGSHEEGPRGSRGRGRGRGDRRPDGGRGRGAPVKENAPARKAEPRPKRTEPPTTKISAPTPAKTANVFDLLDDSDSDSD
ncbi:unnamed protein product [Phytophthora lilii]|uniref:Unnamed protein product n=1 Tax=Phytophthora lilii TaxID=2077276 RepID=A0A9W6TL17_9STRA|nr:unnamed protein product [Phytophthora lilii]